MDKSFAYDQLPLRQKKFAQTKLGLLKAAMEALEERPLEVISVKELCETVSISEASFFNYFARKTDLLVYFVQLWSLEMGWHAARLAEEKGGLAAIEEIFALTARQTVQHPALMAEIIAQQARMPGAPELAEVTLAERLLAYPELEGIGEVQGAGLDALLPPLLEQAVENGELPPALDRQGAVVALASLFFGVPIILRRVDVRAIEPAYREQLQWLWAGLRARPRREAP